jgi:hypothetical protein
MFFGFVISFHDINIYILEDTMNTFMWHLQFSGMLQPVALLISVKSWKNLLSLPS